MSIEELLKTRSPQEFPALTEAARGCEPADPQYGDGGRRSLPRPRCWYYRQGFGLLAMKDGKSLREGENRYHAILGNGGVFCKRIES